LQYKLYLYRNFQTMKASKPFNLLILVLILFNEIAPAQLGSYYPPPSEVNYQTDTLTIYPPDSLPGEPVILMGYNIYVDEDFYGNVNTPFELITRKVIVPSDEEIERRLFL